jgi:hypothetical protein
MLAPTFEGDDSTRGCSEEKGKSKKASRLRRKVKVKRQKAKEEEKKRGPYQSSDDEGRAVSYFLTFAFLLLPFYFRESGLPFAF